MPHADLIGAQNGESFYLDGAFLIEDLSDQPDWYLVHNYEGLGYTGIHWELAEVRFPTEGEYDSLDDYYDSEEYADEAWGQPWDN